MVLGTWDVGDTAATFYQAVDVDIVDETDDGTDGGTSDVMNKVGSIHASISLNPGDSVQTRVFDANGENSSVSDSLTIKSSADGDSKNWPYSLAQVINASKHSIVAGMKDSNGNINPVYGSNFIYTKQGRGIESVEIKIDQLPPLVSSAELAGLQSEYPIDDGSVTLDFLVMATAKYTITVKLVNPNGKEVDYQSMTMILPVFH